MVWDKDSFESTARFSQILIWEKEWLETTSGLNKEWFELEQGYMFTSEKVFV